MGIAPDPKLVDLAWKLFREVSGRPGVEGAAFIGALARNMYATPRATDDVDIAVVLRDAAAYESLVEGLKRLGYFLKNETGEQGGEYPSLAQFDGPVHLDLLIAHTEFEKQAVRKRQVFGDGDKSLSAVSPEDLVVYKLLRCWEQDKADIEAVVRAKGDSIDWELVQRFVSEFGFGERAVWARELAQRIAQEPKL